LHRLNWRALFAFLLSLFYFLLQLCKIIEYFFQEFEGLRAVAPEHIRIVMEFRHHSWFTEAALRVCQRWDICRAAVHVANDSVASGSFCLAGARGGFHPELALDGFAASGGVTFLRLYGSTGLRMGDYGARFCRALAQQLRNASASGDQRVIVSFANVDSGTPMNSAIVSAKLLATQLVSALKST
jgi:uncharacterized protein YecE (DUF72 family)